MHTYCMKTAAAIAPKSAMELPTLMLAEDSSVGDEEELPEVWLPWKLAPDSVADMVEVTLVVEGAVRVAELMVVFLGSAVLLPALMVPMVPAVPTGATAVVVVMVTLEEVSIL